MPRIEHTARLAIRALVSCDDRARDRSHARLRQADAMRRQGQQQRHAGAQRARGVEVASALAQRLRERRPAEFDDALADRQVVVQAVELRDDEVRAEPRARMTP
ncbi:hypothetical protein Bsp3421_002020 [Burkholderia sp. FERM BP-3421]|uniref:hypothetical protein n=1 Tax=Burkholderia sp. FERM BP-3421 TaxID=1494466 RepID=UPI002362CCA6|nr:hypothetical protein [Burkholderia sp. FERM BP-3421]WDD92049.1 hypothetical protein Bsp3421_002020 [Burkholderia sp. FERM BP-3421]